VFQAASNFNAVESTSESIPPDRTFFSTNYIYDDTQGPAASISAGAAAITRVHAPFYDPATAPSDWRQTANHQINLLDDDEVAAHIPVVNGYAVLRKGLPEFPSVGSSGYERLLRSTRIAYHRSVQVTTSGISEATEDNAGCYVAVDNTTNQRIDQIFVAALNIEEVTNYHLDSQQDNLRQKFVLQSAFDGTYLGAIVNRRKHLYLTLIGGGVFGNNIKYIWNAIIQAHIK
jgi:hypothetical protein